jgi:membrane protein implicated in regulation of membrane protease activity
VSSVTPVDRASAANPEPALGLRLCFAFAMLSLAIVAGLFEAYGLWYVTFVLFLMAVVIVVRTHRRWSGKSSHGTSPTVH